MSEIIEHFKKIASLPHCSYKAEKLKEHIIVYAKACGFDVQVDAYENILASKGTPRICLQAHYDMVCIGHTEAMELVFEGDILSAKDATLGADNGMGMAIIFTCMQKFANLEVLFTSNEEVGLIGASQLQLQLQSSYLLNLDGEQEDEIYVGCAGGVDIVASREFTCKSLPKESLFFEISVDGFIGGHSGVDIDKDIPSAIKVLVAELLQHKNMELISLEGGQMRNSIPKSAKAIIATGQDFSLMDARVRKCQIADPKQEALKDGAVVLLALNAIHQGVRVFDKEFQIPSISANIGKIRQDGTKIIIDVNVRAMSDDDLLQASFECMSLFRLAGFSVEQEQMHAAWKPQIGTFTKLVQEQMQKTYDGIALRAIHAGLECGVLIQTQQKKIEAVSIGPTIRFPHSTKEECDLASVARIFQIVEQIIKKVG
ncbi:MAG: M20/M25/M40 family metallo-hydrolase [Sulfurospirillum sp.]|nr:M20/M25/M40 family metallo-hydrolase [Sulfurospirillum sp.]